MDDLFKYWLLLVAKAVLWAVDVILDLLLGFTITGGTREERRKAWLHHEHSAHVVDVVWRAHYVQTMAHSGSNFLYVHDKYVSPRYILEKKNVTLFTMDATHVYFCVTDEDVDVYDMESFPFIFLAHYSQARKLIILPISSFHKLGDDLGDPTVPVSLVNMTARCGSTLISQMMSRVPHVRSMSEPWVLVALNLSFRKRLFNWDEARRLMQTCLRLLCKVEPGCRVDRIVIKFPPPVSPMFAPLSELFPDFRLVFNTRHPRPSLVSTFKVVRDLRRFLYVRSGLHLRELVHNFFPLPYTDEYCAKLESVVGILLRYNQEELLAFTHGAVLLTYTEARSIYSHVVLYENLVEDPEGEARRLFGALGVPEDHVPSALEALKQDSQKSTLVKTQEKLVIPDETWSRLSRVLGDLKLGVSYEMSVEEFKAIFK